MKKIVVYKFPKNGVSVSVSYAQPPNHAKGRWEDDCLWLNWHTQEGEEIGIGMRNDEALLIAEMLVEAVRVTTEAYRTSKPIKSYRIKKQAPPVTKYRRKSDRIRE